jgi:hypothetical protein
MIEAHTAFPNSLGELLEACVSFHRQSKNRMSVERARERRAGLAGFAKLFHDECGTLTPAVQKRIEDLENGNCVVLMTAHQPNFFAYSGVLRKATLNFVLAKKLESILKIPVVNFFGIADQDFTDDRWVRSCELPAVQRTGGLLSIEVKLPEKLMLNRVPKPSRDLLLGWKSEIEKWLNETVRSIERLCKELNLPEACPVSTLSVLHENLGSFWKITEDCWMRSKKYSDFNGFLMSKIVNDAWGYDTIFARFSECQQVFADDFSFLLSRFKDYSRLLKEAKEMPHGEGMTGGVSDQEPFLAPFWYHCHCGSKAKLFLEEKNGSLLGNGSCVRCQEHYELDFGPENDPDILSIASQISARAIPMGLVFFNGLQPSCYVGGAAGIGYLLEAEYVAKGLGIPFPQAVVWRPHDKYSGVGQVEALLELKRIYDYLHVTDLSLARTLLEARVSEIQGRLDELEVLKSEVVEKLRKRPGDEKLKQEMREASMRRTDFVKSSSLSVVCHELKMLENVSRTLDLTSSVIDYCVSVGLKETSTQWVRYLNEDGDLHSEVKLESALDQDVICRRICE